MKYDTIREAAYAWVESFDAIPYGIIEKLMRNDPGEIVEITPPKKYDQVYIYTGKHDGEYGQIVGCCKTNANKYWIELYKSRKKIVLDKSEFEVKYDGVLPMWGTLWSFHENIDNDWLSGEYADVIGSGLQAMADCGFRIYEQEDYRYIFGIDGAGYDFYTDHWIPLYQARGLHWHKED